MTRARDTPEQTRNRLLRGVDWRFLLPDPWPKRVAAVASPSLRTALETVFGPLTAVGPGADADLAVAQDPDEETLARLAASLREGGVCWVEWSSPLGGPRVARRRLEAAGFHDARCFWRWPSAERCRLWLPLDEPGARRYFGDWRRPADGAVDRLLDAARRAQARAAIRLGLLPVCALARKSMNAGRADDAPAEPWAIRESRVAEGAAGSASARRSCLLVTGGPRSTSKVVALVVDEPSGRPALAVKLARVAESVPGMAREAAVLHRLQASAAGPMPGAPQVAFERSLHGILAVGETLMSGQPLQNLLRRGNVSEWARKATEWQIRLATHSRATSAPAERIAAPALAQFEASFGGVVEAADLRRTRERLQGLGALPVVCEQRDFSPWNVFVTPTGGLAVLDWESAEMEGLPALDLIYFLTYMGFQVTGATRSGGLLESYREGLDATTLIGRAAQASLTHYADALGLDRLALHPLRLLTWLVHSRSEHERLVADSGGPPPATALRRSLFVRLWQEELRWSRA